MRKSLIIIGLVSLAVGACVFYKSFILHLSPGMLSQDLTELAREPYVIGSFLLDSLSDFDFYKDSSGVLMLLGIVLVASGSLLSTRACQQSIDDILAVSPL